MGRKPMDLVGKRFGRLKVLQKLGRLMKSKSIFWLCICDCGKEKNVRGDYLRSGGTSSCGCFGDENRRRKGRWKEREQICTICGDVFLYKSSITPRCCSKKCRRRFDADSVRNRRSESFPLRIAYLLRMIKHRSKKTQTEYDLDKEFVVNLFNNQKGKCRRTGIKFILNNCGQSEGKSPWSLSIDKIDPNKGYTKDNIQLVCLMYNFCKGVWTDREVKHFAKKLFNRKDK